MSHVFVVFYIHVQHVFEFKRLAQFIGELVAPDRFSVERCDQQLKQRKLIQWRLLAKVSHTSQLLIQFNPVNSNSCCCISIFLVLTTRETRLALVVSHYFFWLVLFRCPTFLVFTTVFGYFD